MGSFILEEIPTIALPPILPASDTAAFDTLKLQDPVEGLSVHTIPWTVPPSHRYLLAVFPIRPHIGKFLHPTPILTTEETQRLTSRRSFILYEFRHPNALISRVPPPTILDPDQEPVRYHRYTVLRAAVYFSDTEALLWPQTSPFLLGPWPVFHRWFDFVESYLAQRHRITQFVAGATGHIETRPLLPFWRARGYHNDSLIPARLSKHIDTN